jgi:hypothetical protein
MKGTFFAKPLEWNIQVQGESWAQGDTLQGEVTVKNHGTEALDLAGHGVVLALGDIKKVHSRDPKAFKPWANANFTTLTVAAGASSTLPFALPLPPNCAVTDRRVSPYITYGNLAQPGHLQLAVGPRKLFTEVTKLLETFLRFKPKDVKAGKAGVEFKLLPPSSREWAHVESLLLTQTVEGEKLVLDFLFNVKVINTQSVTTALAKEQRQTRRELAPREYLLGKDMPNQDGLLKALQGALDEVKAKGY